MCKPLLTCHHCSVQAAEAEKKAQAAQNKAADGPQLEHDDADDLDPNQYHERRLRALETTRASGRNPYPHKFHLTMYIPEYIAKYKDVEAGTREEQQKESLAGTACCFLTLQRYDCTTGWLQVMY